MLELFSLNEASAIAEIPPKAIRTALEKKIVKPSHRFRVGKAVRHQFSAGDVLFIKMLTEFPFALSKEDKNSLARVLAGGQRQATHWSRHGSDLVYQFGKVQLRVDCTGIRQQLESNMAAYRWGKDRVTSSPELLAGEPVFRGTRIPVQHVAELFRKNVPEQEIAEDFPRLSARDLAYARLVSRLGQKPGRPRKKLQTRREQ